MESEKLEKELLLSDEKCINNEDLSERKYLVKRFLNFPTEFFSKLRHFQPQIGCLNACSICSKYAGCNVSYWNERRIRNVIAALKYSSPRKDKPSIVWDRDNHISGVIFSYLDNDVGNYYYLDRFIELAYLELGVKTRISTVGYSRHNTVLNKMHKYISENPSYLNGVRLSFTPYEVGWASINDKKFNRLEYTKDMANFLSIYKPYYQYAGSGSRKFCVELRYKPLVVNDEVYILEYEGNFIICSGNYLFISCKKDITFIDTQIEDPYIHRLSLNNTGHEFNKIKITQSFKTYNDIIHYLNNNDLELDKEVTIFKVMNRDGEYYAVNPILKDVGNDGMYIYPKTKTREKSGFIITERFFLNELFNYKNSIGIKSNAEYKKATWKDVDNVLLQLKERASEYKNNEYYKYDYILNEMLPMLLAYRDALHLANYPPSVFFDKNFTIDTGIICNLGRALYEFKGFVSIENEPLTLNHERNYGTKNSTMTLENTAWRLSCGYNDTIIVEKLNLSETATKEGQVSYSNVIKLNNNDEKLTYADIKNYNLIPGQREVVNGD